MCKKLVYVTSLVIVLNLLGNAFAVLPTGWLSQDIGITEPGSAHESNGTWTVTGNGNDIWDNSDAFHYACVQLNGDGEITARVVDIGRGPDEWAKGGVMIRETLNADSRHAMMVLTGGAGGGIAFQARRDTGSNSISFHDAITASPPHWIKLVREGDFITGYHSYDGVYWELFTDASPDGDMTNPIELTMPERVYIGLCVTSHRSGELRTYTFDNVNASSSLFACMPNPANGSLYSDTWVSLSWRAGDSADSHDIYFGENFEDVDNGIGNTFQRNQTLTNFNVGLPGYPYPDGLKPGVTYYWRIDEVQADGTILKGDVWNFVTVPRKATGPIPADGAKFIDYRITLSWNPGFGSLMHDVYFGDNFNDVNDGTGGTFRGYTKDAQFDVGFSGTPCSEGLAPSGSYYWRIDEIEVDGQTTHTGDVWAFTTARLAGGLQGRYYMGMNFDRLVLTRIDPQINFYWEDAEPAPGVGYDQFSVRWAGEVEAAFTETYRFYTNSDDGVRLWIEDRLLIDNWTDHSATVNVGSIDLVAGNKYSLIMEMYENSGGAIAELSWSSPSTPKQIIPQAALAVSFSAYEPSPADGAIGVRNKPILRWTPGGGALQHDVYLGTHFGDVNDADMFDETGIYRGRWDDASYAVEKLNIDQTYFWRIDEYNTDGTLDKGGVWRFTVGDAVEETAEYQVSSGQDDGYATGMSLQNLNSEYMKIGTITFGNYTSGMVFRNVDISQRAAIVSAHLKIQSHNNRLSDTVYGTIQAEAADDSAGFGDTGTIGSLPKTNASVDWDLTEPWSADTWYTSPDISSVLQEVVNRGGWSEGNSLAIIYSTKNNEGGYRQFSSFDRGTDYAPILEITYIP